jgi:ABC-type dipeptide/oligopeptide/nickel transport system ATPase component
MPETEVKNIIQDAESKSHPLPESHVFGDKPAPIPPALIKDVLPETGVAAIVGQSGSGKSFQAIHLGTCLIPDCKQDFYIDRYRIKRKGGVLYFVMEGRPAFPLRLTAAFESMLKKQMEFGERSRQPFLWNFYQPKLLEKGSDLMIKLAKRDIIRLRDEFGVPLVAIFIDTIGLAALYENENSASQVTKVLSSLYQISEATGALVVPVDHMGKEQEFGARGSSAKVDLPETVLECLGDRADNGVLTNLRMRFRKIRDAEAGRIIPYRLALADMGRNEDGDSVTTCTIEWQPDRPIITLPKRRGPQRHKTDGTLQRAVEEVGLPANEAALRAAFYRCHGGSTHAANLAYHRALKAAQLTVTNGRVDYML